ncbi:uncharacterized protein LOC129971442 [Argiope bruennichi]|uniref:uncharacterized protein LOC129971442 n=1 Tax=Argiope bruennichi TaxID=94029 RepID=UPI00249497BB|nr:uncharacterized protein LOC129971442 [Argiope bruennichi]
MLSSAIGLFAVVALLNSFVSVHSEPTWQSFRVTWGLNLLSSRTFAKLPQTESRARSDGFARLAGECSGGKFLGHRYMKGLDTAAVIIYDENGYVAGIQHGIPKNDVEKVNTSFSFDRSSAYQLDKILGEEEVYFITTYFVDPNIICNGGRTKLQYEEEGVGTGLWVQNGTDPVRDSVQVPLYEKDMEGTHWVKGGCFRTMGVHYWYGAHENMTCTDFFPVTAIYNRGKLTNFAFASFGNYEFSRRFEHPSSTALTLFLPTPIPKCINDEYERSGGVSSMHVFFSVRPWNTFC